MWSSLLVSERVHLSVLGTLRAREQPAFAYNVSNSPSKRLMLGIYELWMDSQLVHIAYFLRKCLRNIQTHINDASIHIKLCYNLGKHIKLVFSSVLFIKSFVHSVVTFSLMLDKLKGCE